MYISNIRIFVDLADCLGELWKRTRFSRRREYFSLKNKSAKDAKGGDSRTCDEIERIVLYPLLESRVFLPCIFDTVRVLFVNYFYERCAYQEICINRARVKDKLPACLTTILNFSSICHIVTLEFYKLGE